MRNLTIQRAKSFVGSLTKTHIFMEDPNGTERIDNTACTKLGFLKNGLTQTFQIPDYAVRIFAVSDLIFKGVCYDVYNLEAGVEDVFLTGAVSKDFFAGYPFRFDNNDSAEVQAIRQKNRKAMIPILIGTVIIGGVIGGFNGYNSAARGNSSEPMSTVPQTFENAYFSITLTESFTEGTSDGFDAYYESDDVLVLASQETFDGDMEFAQMSLTEYGQLIMDANELGGYVNGGDGLVFFTYTESIDGDDYRYDVYLYKSSDAFWMIQFVTFADTTELYQDSITQWAKTVTFK